MTDPITVSRKELQDLIREAVRDELREFGLRADDTEHIEATREDLRFAHRMRTASEGFAARVGMAVITIVVGGVTLALWEGFRVLSQMRTD